MNKRVLDEAKRLTRWLVPDQKLTASWYECTQCHSCGQKSEHGPDCNGFMIRVFCDQTQFGRVTAGRWARLMILKMRSAGSRAFIGHNDDGKIAIYEI